ncbi:putative 6-phosphogluconate dehydrogenase YqeC [Propionispora sp. 2/2-37]|uniref:phosphogluconate dehydrogenase (NAD(+)-dependent, decarboxylating) n=1 Tax=Propionispora sp. 2/2-37 TaxID=1677858 RepID=UPI0006BB5842|nr:decarboxylating 6-phosphogluconate dehydrogenase [Propionispora sp. 2/2-37]CUH96186.1 putative 6-phosphogluconate dehydrogenase YqeC [Propionispora sp. 2/2-37]
MKLGLIGIGKMGYNLAENFLDKGHELIVYDINPDNMKGLDTKGANIAGSIEELVNGLRAPKIIYLMLPVGDPVEQTIQAVVPYLSMGDIVIDGGNSHYKDTVRRYAMLKERGIYYLDCGTSGGISGAKQGVCLMIGGDREIYDYCAPLFLSMSLADGCIYTGPSGSGHYCKMIHNGIEYGMMQAIAEGFELLQRSGFAYNLKEVASVWNHGSVIRSWLMELLENALSADNTLSNIKGVMYSTGEGKWSVEEALDNSVCTPVIALSLLMRYRSLETDTFSGKVVAALRNQFGGHAVAKCIAE